MSSLREIKDRIASVRSTLKITSAMKLVASSKLRKAQKAIEALRPYADTLSDILASASEAAGGLVAGSNSAFPDSEGEIAHRTVILAFASNRSETTQGVSGGTPPVPWGCRGIEGEIAHRTVILAFASNSSMCGAFNANVIKKTLEFARGCEGSVEAWAFGRKMAEGLRKGGCAAARDYSQLVAHPSFEAVAALAEELRGLYESGAVSEAVLVYNHFVSTGRQEVVIERYLPFRVPSDPESSDASEDFIIEPSRPELVAALMPQILKLRLYAALLDSAASEHASRMIAMQAATDNGESLLGELTLEYNKGRQQKITSEILDLVGAGLY